MALLPVLHPGVDWTALRTLAPGRRSLLAGLEPVPDATVTLATVARIARVGRAAVAVWRRRHGDFPAPVGGTVVSPLLDPDQVAAWLLAHGKIAVPYVPDLGTLLLRTAGGGTRTVRLDAPEHRFADSADDEDTVGGWVVEADADALMTAAEYPSGAGILRLSVRGEPAVAVRGGVTLAARSDARRGRVWVALRWRPAG
ncbi:hypothetical protein [Streptomyces sp. NPDC097619]|uniref:hypothetical protein n=1 Tax=Streptomyces sp. NPDC097619 TaxID=3157228 RepID=UPI00331F6C2F